MTINHLAYALLAGFLGASSASAQMPVVWKFAKGQVFEAERIVTQKQTVELKGKKFKQERLSTWHVRLEVKEKQGNAFVILATLTKVEQKLAGAGADMIEPKLTERMQGSAFRLHVTPAGRLTELHGYEDFLIRLADKDKAQIQALRVTFPEAAVTKALADLFGPLPGKESAWQHEYVEPIPHFGALRSTAKYESTGTKKGRHVIDYTIETKYEAPKADMMALFRIVKGTIDSDKARGTIAFDANGLDHERTMQLRGTLTIEAMGGQQSLAFTSENDVKVRVRAAKK